MCESEHTWPPECGERHLPPRSTHLHAVCFYSCIVGHRCRVAPAPNCQTWLLGGAPVFTRRAGLLEKDTENDELAKIDRHNKQRIPLFSEQTKTLQKWLFMVLNCTTKLDSGSKWAHWRSWRITRTMRTACIAWGEKTHEVLGKTCMNEWMENLWKSIKFVWNSTSTYLERESAAFRCTPKQISSAHTDWEPFQELQVYVVSLPSKRRSVAGLKNLTEEFPAPESWPVTMPPVNHKWCHISLGLPESRSFFSVLFGRDAKSERRHLERKEQSGEERSAGGSRYKSRETQMESAGCASFVSQKHKNY